MSQNITDLFLAAKDSGDLSPQSMQALTVIDVGEQIQAGLGISADEVTSSEVLLATILVDDSSSIASEHNEQNVRDGYNLILDALRDSKQGDNVLVHTAYLNGMQYPFVPLNQAVRLDAKNYRAKGNTPLYDQELVVLGRVLAKTQEFANYGIPVRSITFTLTDGADCGSRRRAKDVAPVIRDLLRTENHIIMAMGIDDGSTDFAAVFAAMGIPANAILTAANSAGDIRRKCQVVSQSFVRASQGAAGFSKVAIGGFGT